MNARVQLKDIASFSKGEQINGENLIEDGVYPYLNGGIQPSGRWTACNAPGNTITISEGGNSCGYVNLMTEPFWCGAHCYYLYDLSVDVQYLYFALKSQQARLMGIRTGACMPNIKKNDLGCFDLTIHTEIAEQKRIVQQLLLCQTVIEQRQRQLRALDALIKALFVELFGDPVSNPFGLPTKKLSELGSLDRGRSQHRPRNDPELLGGPYPLIQTGEVSSAGLYITEYHNTYSEIGLKQSKMWKAGTLCITIAANIAQTAIMSFDACFPDSVVGFVPNDEVNALYIHYWFGFFQKILEDQAPQVAQKNINLKILSDLNVIVPARKTLEQFEAFVSQINKSKVVVQRALKRAQVLFDSLMQGYFG